MKPLNWLAGRGDKAARGRTTTSTAAQTGDADDVSFVVEATRLRWYRALLALALTLNAVLLVAAPVVHLGGGDKAPNSGEIGEQAIAAAADAAGSVLTDARRDDSRRSALPAAEVPPAVADGPGADVRADDWPMRMDLERPARQVPTALLERMTTRRATSARAIRRTAMTRPTNRPRMRPRQMMFPRCRNRLQPVTIRLRSPNSKLSASSFRSMLTAR